MSFAFPEAMEYKMGIVKELLQSYEIDGLFFDWLRTGDVRDNPQTDLDGVADHGYEQPLVEGFKQKYDRTLTNCPMEISAGSATVPSRKQNLCGESGS